MANDEKESRAPVYLPQKTLKNWLRIGHTQGLPPRFEKRMFSSMSGSIQSQLIQALKALDLIDGDWVPTAKLKKLSAAMDDEPAYREIWKSILLDAYPFLATFNVKTATLGMLEEEMEKMGASGGTVAKCIAFFIPAVKDAGMEVSTFIEKPGRRAPANGRGKRAAKPAAARQPDPGVIIPPANNQPVVQPLHTLLLAKYPDFNPEWSAEVQAKWFDGFAKLQQALEGQK